MNFFSFGVREDPQRKERLISIRQSIESSIKFEDDAMSAPINASTLKRLYNINSLWVVEDDERIEIGSANYRRELELFRELSEKYPDIKEMRVTKGAERYHAVLKGEKTYIFSTPIELTHTDVVMMLSEIERNLPPQKVFLKSDTNITEDDS